MEQKTGSAFAPAHISGIFIIDMKKDARLSGSTGCGVCLEDGAVTKVRLAEETEGTTISINGAFTEAATTLSAIKLLTSQPVIVETALSIPVGCGFGASGAGALSAALALNDALSLSLTLNELSQAAHIAEVTNRTGLGDVTGQTFGGIVIRKKAGAPFTAVIDKIPCKDNTISWVSFGKIPTGSVLSDDMKKRAINKTGKLRLKELLKKPTLENFFWQSSAFAKEIELMSPKVKDAIEAVEAKGGLASQAMLGDAVFAMNDKGALLEFGEVHTSRISNVGVHLL
ncbi:putative kinase, sugar kinase superfamily [Candidatus Methanoperedens nitroreducens]|uniref:Pantoate kinase n=1 Tax=Candidatus Methanoperedens nitratireducens TaxID=1392998 RepID=A0A062V269_9EURY|nr:pantoate kinase [Candidatus Methanoperedens nitroreducens]KCZ70738.1 putative kinase, sugar kinase superfamily [Candidatus Methanoperedens nitroreducens]MDJ1420595.1 pantoate kinase [Candidatus Methanoperedens sp.]